MMSTTDDPATIYLAGDEAKILTLSRGSSASTATPIPEVGVFRCKMTIEIDLRPDLSIVRELQYAIEEIVKLTQLGISTDLRLKKKAWEVCHFTIEKDLQVIARFDGCIQGQVVVSVSRDGILLRFSIVGKLDKRMYERVKGLDATATVFVASQTKQKKLLAG